MLRLIVSIAVGILALSAAVYYFSVNLPGLGVIFGGIALITAVNYFGRYFEGNRHVYNRVLRTSSRNSTAASKTQVRSKPLAHILLFLLGTPVLLGFVGGAIGDLYEQVTIGSTSGSFGLLLGQGGVILGLAIGAVLSVK